MGTSQSNVRFTSKADIDAAQTYVCFVPILTLRVAIDHSEQKREVGRLERLLRVDNLGHVR